MADDADDVLAALDAVTDALAANREATERVLSRAEAMRAQRAEGRSYRDILNDEDRPLIVQMISEKLERLSDAGSRLRRAQARALHREGLTTDQIARLFGVTRQRVSALLQHGRERTPNGNGSGAGDGDGDRDGSDAGGSAVIGEARRTGVDVDLTDRAQTPTNAQL